MRKIYIAFVAAVLLCLSQTVSAVPAKPGKITVTQPDGSKMTIIVHGDEWFHYVTDEAGNILENDEKGFFVKATGATLESISEKMGLARAARTAAMRLEQKPSAIMKAQAKGSPRIPVILVQFRDKSFSISDPVGSFKRLLTEKGYSANGGTGSVLDYYSDQSRGAYTPQFVVLDVVTLSGSVSTYGSTDEYAAKALYEACQKLDSSVDFSQFDNDGDGTIDMALLYYAGYNEAEGAPSETIWPHQFYVPYVVTNAQAFDGVKLNRYFCTSELKGTSGTNMCGIGTTCHEFAHSLGLPDFYDTNYNEYGDGEAGATYQYDVMCSGPYNNRGCTPPWMNAEELMMLGWMDDITEISSAGPVTIPSIDSPMPVAYKTSASAQGEYFLYECRPGTGWDAPLAPGMLVYHVDKSPEHQITWKTQRGSSTQTAFTLWEDWDTYNAINCNGSHPCFYIVPSGAQSSLNYSGSSFTYPGPSNVTSYTPYDWSGGNTGFTAIGIAFDSASKSVSFTFVDSDQNGIVGVVMDSDGNPIQGATVTVSSSPSASNVSASRVIASDLRVMKPAGAPLDYVTTGADGSYMVLVDAPGTYMVTIAKEGFVSNVVKVAVSQMTARNFYLVKTGETLPSDLHTYADDTDWYSMGFGSTSYSYMFADLFPSTMLGPYEGKQIKSISFMVGGNADSQGNTTTTGSVYVLLDFGTDRKVFVQVEQPSVTGWNTVDLTDMELVIPNGKDIYAGYALKNWAYQYPLVVADARNPELAGYYSAFNTSTATWFPISDSSDNYYVHRVRLTIGDYEQPETGYNYIADPKFGYYRTGDVFDLNLVETSSDLRPDSNGITWYFDDEPVNGSVRLSSNGVHTVTAEFHTMSGTRKTVELEITVE